jgi:N-acetyl-anhydromuramyl-L-alanine amidase AmpD
MNMDDENAIWLPSSNFDAGRGGATIDRIILHTTEGSFDGALSWLRGAGASDGSGSSNRDSSSHYVVSADGSRIAQLVREADTAWAAGNLAFNRRGINIEQEGYAARGDFSDALYAATGALVGRVTRRHGIPLDRTHVIGHMNVPDPNNPARTGGIDHHGDPGSAYDFERLLQIATATSEPRLPCRSFPETRHTICDRFRAFWESYGDEALPTFGYPLSEAFRDDDGVLIQYFERARFEWRPGSGQNRWDVLLGRVGDEASEPARRSNDAAFAPVERAV